MITELPNDVMLLGPNAPSPSTLTSWLMAHPSYEVMRPGVNPTSKYYNQSKPAANPAKPPANPIKVNRSLLRQTTLQTKPQGIQLIAALPQVTQLPPSQYFSLFSSF